MSPRPGHFVLLACVTLACPAPAQEQPRTDLYGDPLPTGAVSRLGTLRWRHAAQTIAFSPDGKVLAATGKGTRLFDAASGKLLRRFDSPSNYVSFAPDSKTLITTTYGYVPVIRCWDVATGKERRQFKIEGGGNFFPHWSADGKLLITRSFQGKKGDVVALWDMASGKELRSWRDLTRDRGGSQVALTPDARAFALHGRNGLYLFDSSSGKELRRFASPIGDAGGTLETPTFAFSADGTRVACTDGGSVRVWETATGQALRYLTVPGGKAGAVALTPDGRFVAAAPRGAIFLWDVETGKLLHTVGDRALNMPTYVLAFAPDSKTLATQDHLLQSIRLWEVASGRELSVKDAPATRVEGLAFGPDGKTVVSVGPGDPVCLWDTATGKPLRRYANAHYLGLSGGTLAIPPAGTTLFVSLPTDVSGWDLASGKRLYAIKDPGRQEFYRAFPPDGKTLLVVYPGAEKRPAQGGQMPARRRLPPPPPPPIRTYWTRIGLWDARTGAVMRSFQVDADHVRHLVLSADGKTLAGTGVAPALQNHRAMFVWDLARGLELRRLPMSPIDTWNGIALSRDGRTLISGPHHARPTGKNSFQLWEVATGKERGKVECGVVATHAPLTTFFGDRLAALATEDTIFLVDPLTGQELRRLRGHKGDVVALAFSADGRLLASGSQDTTVLVWNLTGVRRPAEKVRLSGKELAARWAELAGEDAGRAYQAIQQLRKDPDQATALLGEHLRPAVRVAKGTIVRLIAGLDNKDFAVRQQASQSLLDMGEVAEPALKALLLGQPSLEVRRRAETILEQLRQRQMKPRPIPSGEELRQLRALEILEHIGTAEARRVLERLAAGAPEARLTQEARASLQRLPKFAAAP